MGNRLARGRERERDEVTIGLTGSRGCACVKLIVLGKAGKSSKKVYRVGKLAVKFVVVSIIFW